MNKIKTIISACLSSALIIGSTAAFAAPADDFEAAMKEQIYSAEYKMNMSLGVGEMSEELMNALGLEDDLAVYFTYDGAMKMSEDMKTMQMDMDMTINGMGESSSVRTYLDMDLTDEENPKYVQIMKVPEEEKYMVMDYSSNDEFMTQFDAAMNNFASEDMKKLIAELNEQIDWKTPEYKDGVYSLVYSEDEIKDALRDMMLKGEDLYLPLFTGITNTIASYQVNTADTDASSTAVIGGVDGPTNIYVSADELTDEDREEYRDNINKFFDALDDVKLFADDAVTLDVTLDDDKHLSTMDVGIYLDTNIYDAVTKMGPVFNMSDADMDAFKETVTEENSDIKASFEMQCEFSNVNGDVNIEFPEITDENSIDILNQPQQVTVNLGVEPTDVDGQALLPLRRFCNALGISDDNIYYDNGVVTVEDNVNGVTKFVLTINEKLVTYTDEDGNIYTEELASPAILINDRTFVTTDFADILGYTWVSGDVFMTQK